RQPKAGELYIAHFLGAGGASDLINSAANDPDGIAALRFPAAARANRSIFYDRSGAPRGNAEVYNALVAKHGESGDATQYASGQPMTLTAFAAARRSEAMFQSLFTDTGSRISAFAPASRAGTGAGQEPGTLGEAVQNLWLNFFGKPHVETRVQTASPAPASGTSQVAPASPAATAVLTAQAPAGAAAATRVMPNGRNHDPARLVAPDGSPLN
ncbi:MAG: hypothetical protein AB7S46_06660, partial [Flavobacteriaceae bacterium]